MSFRPVDVARKLGLSTTTIRKYEEFGVIPPVTRSSTGYRLYTEEHMAYFICVREMLAGFSLTTISRIMGFVMAKKTEAALWMVNKAQADLHQEKLIAKKITLKLKPITGMTDESTLTKGVEQELLTINDVSRETGVPVTTIRYWDKVGLISAERCMENNYRRFTTEHIRQILTIYALKFSSLAKGLKHSINQIGAELERFDYSDSCNIAQMTEDIEKYLDNSNRAQIRSIAALYHLCLQVEANDFRDSY